MSEQTKLEADIVERLRKERFYGLGLGRQVCELLDEAAAEITRLRAERPGWRTIESAPKDVPILLLLPDDRQSVGQWDDDKYARKPRPYWNYDSAHFRTTWARSAQPVAWQPLPA